MLLSSDGSGIGSMLELAVFPTESKPAFSDGYWMIEAICTIQLFKNECFNDRIKIRGGIGG